jgi:DNA helicase-2/ATP-dependent DNA helicase PcrA
MLREIPELLSKYRGMARHLLVDEYQDINAAQFELIWILSEGQRDGLFVVGDDDQSIYSWRGGSPSYIREFRRYFGRDAVVAPLSKSYRCHRHILEGAMNIVKTYAPARLSKGDFKYRVEDGPTIKIHNVPSDEKEAKAIKKIIEESIPAEDVLVLYPQRQYGNEIAAQLRASQIQFSAPVNIPGAGMPLIAHIANWLSNPTDNLSFRRLIEAYFQNPKSGIPSSRVRKPDKKEQRENAYGKVASLWDAVVSGRTGSLWESLQTSKATDGLPEAIDAVFRNLREVFSTKADVAEFVSSIARDLVPWKTINDYLEEVSAWVEYGSQPGIMGADADVRLMTLQAAKGLEAKVVCVVGVEEGTIPKSGEPATILEQSRLLYVSMTRAVNELHLFHARKRSSDVVLRNVFKDSGPPDIRPSQFLNAIPTEHFERVFHKY